MKIVKKYRNLIIGIVIGTIVTTGISIYATYRYNATEIGYSENKNVAQALNELYTTSQLDQEIETLKSEVANLKNSSGVSLSDVYPVGSIYISTSSTNPSQLFGGTWESYGSGRTLVGVDTTQTEFNTVNKTGGEKTHFHYMPMGFDSSRMYIYYDGTSNVPYYGSNIVNGNVSSGYIDRFFDVVKSSGNLRIAATTSESSLQPYITVYMYRRTA